MTYYSGIYEEIPLNIVDIPQSLLDIDHKTRSNPLKWKGQFSPQLVQALLRKYAIDSSRIYDPFLGSGTVLLEAGHLGQTAYGSEINPAAVILARTYEFINVDMAHRQYLITQVDSALDKRFPLALFTPQMVNPANHEIPANIQKSLLKLHQHFTDPHLRQLIETIIILVDFHQEKNLSTSKVFQVWQGLKKLLITLPFNHKQIAVFHCDTRQTPLADSSIDLVITSPPYINVFNYHQQYRRSAESLDWNLLRIAKSEFGSNRKHRGNRFLTVVQYCLDIAQTLNELARVATHSARLIFVVGRESKIKGTPFYNGAIFVELAQKLGYSPLVRQERQFMNQFGNRIYEDIIHLTPATYTMLDNAMLCTSAREVASNVLMQSLSYAPNDVVADLKMAIDNIAQIEPSPLFKIQNKLAMKRDFAHAN